MNYQVNFQKAKRNYMVLTLEDEYEENGKIKEFKKQIYVCMPKKRIFTVLMDMQEIVDEREETQTAKEKNEYNRKVIEELYELTAQILSNNLKKEKITVDWVDDNFSIDQIKDFLTQYANFANGEASSPN